MKKKLKLLQDTAFNNKGDILTVVSEDDESYYYYDSFKRWCYLDKSEEKIFFEIISKPIDKVKKKQ